MRDPYAHDGGWLLSPDNSLLHLHKDVFNPPRKYDELYDTPIIGISIATGEETLYNNIQEIIDKIPKVRGNDIKRVILGEAKTHIGYIWKKPDSKK